MRKGHSRGARHEDLDGLNICKSRHYRDENRRGDHNDGQSKRNAAQRVEHDDRHNEEHDDDGGDHGPGEPLNGRV